MNSRISSISATAAMTATCLGGSAILCPAAHPAAGISLNVLFVGHRGDDGATLMENADRLASARKYERAATAYDAAAKAFKAEGKTDRQVEALRQSATMYERLGDELLDTKAGGVAAAVPIVRTKSSATHQVLPSSVKPRANAVAPKQETAAMSAYLAAHLPGFHIGDAVEVMYNHGTYYPAHILDVDPSGAPLFSIQIQYAPSGPASVNNRIDWVGPAFVRRAKNVVITAHEAAEGPRLGRYKIFSYGAVNTFRLSLGYFDLLPGGVYKASNGGQEYFGSGTYAFDVASSSVRWLSGPYKKVGWSGTFTRERDKKTHQIRMKQNTVAVNTTD